MSDNDEQTDDEFDKLRQNARIADTPDEDPRVRASRTKTLDTGSEKSDDE